MAATELLTECMHCWMELYTTSVLTVETEVWMPNVDDAASL